MSKHKGQKVIAARISSEGFVAWVKEKVKPADGAEWTETQLELFANVSRLVIEYIRDVQEAHKHFITRGAN